MLINKRPYKNSPKPVTSDNHSYESYSQNNIHTHPKTKNKKHKTKNTKTQHKTSPTFLTKQTQNILIPTETKTS